MPPIGCFGRKAGQAEARQRIDRHFYQAVERGAIIVPAKRKK
jgi:hypothetical protein